MNTKEKDNKPCNPDHNGECKVCDCWVTDCAYTRYLNENYEYETKEQLEEMFKKQIKQWHNKQQ